MKRKAWIIILLLLIFTACSTKKQESAESVIPQATRIVSYNIKANYKILHIMSYHTPWEWTDQQFLGFQTAIKDFPLELNIEYKVIALNQKNTLAKALQENVNKAKDLINTWEPDLVYTSDDYVQEAVVKDYINSAIPFIFSGVNLSPRVFGFDKANNITGVMEQELFLPTVQLLSNIVPGIKKLAVITDNGTMWKESIVRMQAAARDNLKQLNIVSWDVIDTFKEYKEKIIACQGQVDAIGFLGIFLFKDEKGNPVSFDDVLQWTVQNSKLPDFSFWKDRVSKGTLCAVPVSAYEQGWAAGKIAYAVLAENKSPADFPAHPTVKGEPVISLARAKNLGLKIDSEILLTCQVETEFYWE